MYDRPKRELIFFIAVTVAAFGQAVWWIAFMARLLDEKVQMASNLGADADFVQALHEQEISRQIMLGSEGLFFLILIVAGAWLIYRALARTSELKFHQQNFLMAVTHELKTPLASIKIYLDAMESTKVSPEKKAGIVPRIRTDVARLEKLVENILDAGRFERKGYRLNISRFDLVRLLNDRLDRMSDYPSKVPLTINRNLLESAVIDGDVAALGRAFDSLLENGMKYNDSDHVVIDATMTGDTKTVTIEIKDNGVGLSAKECATIFNRFYRVGQELVRQKPGTGLGLYLTREIVGAHGGNIVAKSDGPGLGATFVLTLKLCGKNENDSTG